MLQQEHCVLDFNVCTYLRFPIQEHLRKSEIVLQIMTLKSLYGKMSLHKQKFIKSSTMSTND